MNRTTWPARLHSPGFMDPSPEECGRHEPIRPAAEVDECGARQGRLFLDESCKEWISLARVVLPEPGGPIIMV